MPRIDHVAFETDDPDALAAFYERIFEWRERDHDIAVGLFFTDPDGRTIEAITYRSADDPRRP
jgi:catechol 2,3-dioxygenase-like lactoylglutathione lyase family enzyme